MSGQNVTARTGTRDISGARLALTGAAGGMAASLLAYLSTYLLVADDIRNSALGSVFEILSGDASVPKIVGWVLFNAHGVSTTVPGLFGGTSAVDLIGEVAAFPVALYAVPVVFLLLAGAALAVVADAGDPVTGARAGAAAVVGYLPLALGGAFGFAVTVGDAAARPDLVTAVLLAGAVYPVVLGGLGGAAAGAVRGRWLLR